MRLVPQRAAADCGVAALATLLEQTYEDVYLAVSGVEATFRGKCGLNLAHLIQAADAFKVTLKRKPRPDLDTDEGLLVVNWRSPKAKQAIYQAHMVVLAYGVIADPQTGMVLPAEDYLTREQGRAGSLLEVA